MIRRFHFFRFIRSVRCLARNSNVARFFSLKRKMENNEKGALTHEVLSSMQKKFESDPKNLLAQSACAKNDIHEIALKKSVIDSSFHVYTDKVDEIKPITNQKVSGRCWIFALLNVLRVPFAKHHQIEDFEFSESYLYFYDKIERSNFFLRKVLQKLQEGETADGRLLSYLLKSPMEDGGQWEMAVNLVKRYGIIPKKCFADSYSCEQTSRMNSILTTKLREYVRDLNTMVKENATDEKLDSKILACNEEIYKIVSICIGSPPETFTWEYYNKSKVFNTVGPITPLKFFEKYVKPYCDPENKVCLVNDPRPDNPYMRTYSVDCLGNMVGGKAPVYLNLDVKELLKLAVESIKNNEPVWCGVEAGRLWALKSGILDINVFDYSLLFGIDYNKSIDKSERLIYGESCMSHAMAFTAVSLGSNGEPTKFRIENSWGEDRGDKGYLMMTSEWFEQYGFEVIIDKQYIPSQILEVLKLEPKVLPAWDPMGTLASCSC